MSGLENKAPKYLSYHCTPVAAVSNLHNTISQPASADRASGFLCGGPDGLELTADWVSWSVYQF